MSCSNNILESEQAGFACRCDRHDFPPALKIGAGLNRLPRQIATLPEFRRAMLRVLREKAPLAYWQARQEGDFGLMLLEMWAYICDAISFYDEVIAQEAYLRTAQRRAAVRKIVGLLGYLPFPAVSARVKLAAFAEGRQPVHLPAGTSFRSEAFGNNPPQIFELEQDALIHPLANHFNIEPPLPSRITINNPSFLLVSPLWRAVTIDKPVLLIDSNKPVNNQGLYVRDFSTYTGDDGRFYTRINFEANAKLEGSPLVSGLKLLQPVQKAGLWKIEPTYLTLDNLYMDIKDGDYILLVKDTEARWFKVINSKKISISAPGYSATINGSKFTITPSPTPITVIELDSPVNNERKTSNEDWVDADSSKIEVFFDMKPIGPIMNKPQSILVSSDAPFQLSGQPDLPSDNFTPREFFLTDKKKRTQYIEGYIEATKRLLRSNTSINPPLTLPVEVFANVIQASRGERVDAEILGSGNASLAGQTFKLRKKPLTYLPAPTAGNDQGVKSTLSVYVDGIRWTEAATFFEKKETDQVYIVRQNDDGESLVTFGDGVRGSRLPTGQNNIVAHYRFGAGRASPPSGSITQITRPAKGLQSIKNPMAATGGDDAEGADGMRYYAPNSALILGRIVSMQDMEAVVRSFPGVRAVQVEWRWNKEKLQTLAHVWYIGESDIETYITQRLRNLSDPSIYFQVKRASAYLAYQYYGPTLLKLNLKIDPRYERGSVLLELRKALMDTSTGLLSPDKIGIGRPLIRSEIFAAVLRVEGIIAVSGIFWEGGIFSDYEKRPGAGQYFDFEKADALSLSAS